MNPIWRALKFVAKAVFVIAAVIICLAVVVFVGEEFYPAGIETKSVKRALALLSDSKDFTELPQEAEITIDGARAVFRKDTKPYNQLLHLLHEGRSQKLLELSGPNPRLGNRHPCGEMKISSYGLPSHFTIWRSGSNTNCYWIGLPKLTSTGTAFPFFTLDPHVIELIRATSISENYAEPDGATSRSQPIR